MRWSWERLDRAEARLVADARWLPRNAPHPVVIALTTAGRAGALWLLWCGLEAVRPRGDRRFAARTAAAVGVALGAGQLVKRLAPARQRPEAPGGPARRDLPERPDSSSFPSAHAASAAAFTTALLLRDRRLGLLAAPVTTTAVYGRVRARVHWPSDVAAGMIIGVAAAFGVDAVSPIRSGPFCLAVWVGSGLTAGLVFAPRATRMVLTALTAIAASDTIQLVYDGAKQRLG